MLQRLLGEVQRLGLATASSVADRFATLVRGTGIGSPLDAIDVAAAARSLLAPVLSPPAVGGEVESVDLGSAPAGGEATGSVWVHNTTDQPAPDLTLRRGDLIGPATAAIPSAAVALAPAGPVTVPAGASAAIRITVAVPPAAAGGTYRGLLVLSDPPGGVVALRLVVTTSPVTP